jgi:hypothetical protein
MNDRKMVQDDRSRVLANQHARATHITPELRQGAVGSQVQAATPTAESLLSFRTWRVGGVSFG